MATRLGIVGLSGCSYELAYDLLSQSVGGNYSKVRLYGILHVTNSYVSWSSGNASVHTSGWQGIGTYYARGSYTLITRDFTFSHDANGNFSHVIGASLSTTYTSGTASGTLTLPKINRIAITNSATSLDNNDMEGRFQVNYTKYIDSYQYKLRISLPRIMPLTTIDYNTSDEVFSLQSLDDVLEEYTNQKGIGEVDLGFAVETWNGGTQISTGNEKIIKNCKLMNANPIFSNYDVEDVNATTVALTGSTRNNIINVNGYSNIKAIISTANKAVGQKWASVTKYRFKIGDSDPVDIPYQMKYVCSGTESGAYYIYYNHKGYSFTMPTVQSGNELIFNALALQLTLNGNIIPTTEHNGVPEGATELQTTPISVEGIINNAPIGTYELYAIDTRNYSTLVTKQATSVVEYQNVYLNKENCSFVRNNNQVGTGAILTLDGTFWNDNFGVVTNSLTVSYRLKKSDSSTWIDGTTTITPTTSGNSFSFSGLIASNNQDTSWDLDANYNLEVTVSDELSSATMELVLNSAIPTISLDKEGVGIMCAYDRQLGGYLQVNGKVVGRNDYSTNEIEAGKWIDNKTIYKKVIQIDRSIFGTGTASSGTTFSYTHNIANIDVVITAKALIEDVSNSANERWRILPSSYYSSLDWAGQLNAGKNNLEFELGKNFINRIRTGCDRIYVILEYTKTTD